MNYELWDTGSGNIIETFDTLNDLVRSAFALGKVNPDMNPDDLFAHEMTEFDSLIIQTLAEMEAEGLIERVSPFEQLSDNDKQWAAEGWLEREALVRMLADNAEPALGINKTDNAVHDIINNLKALTIFAERWIDYCRVSGQDPFKYFDGE